MVILGVMRKAFYLGLGGFSVTREKTEQLIDELINKKNLNPTEASGLVKELVEKGEQEREAIIGFIRKEIGQLRSELGLVTHSEISQIEDRLRVIEERIQILEHKVGENNH